MLTHDEIESIGNKSQLIIRPIVEYLLDDIARRISEAGQLTSTAAYQIWRLQTLGVSQRQTKKKLRKMLKVSHRELRKLLAQSAETGYNYDVSRLKPQAIPFGENKPVLDILEATIALADENLDNAVQTIGFVNEDGVARPLTQAYKKACDFAFEKVSTGAESYDKAIRQAVRGLSDRGIVTIDYDSGRSVSIEAAVRRNVMGGLGLMNEQIAIRNHDDMGCDGWEISAHFASAPDHEPIQGKQYSDEEYQKLNDSLVRRIGTLNCGHDAFPIILGVNAPQYTPEQLRTMKQENEKGVDFDGKHYTIYEATQQQRAIERAIRKQKRRVQLYETAGENEKLSAEKSKLVYLRSEYKRFSKAANLRTQMQRTYI